MRVIDWLATATLLSALCTGVPAEEQNPDKMLNLLGIDHEQKQRLERAGSLIGNGGYMYFMNEIMRQRHHDDAERSLAQWSELLEMIGSGSLGNGSIALAFRDINSFHNISRQEGLYRAKPIDAALLADQMLQCLVKKRYAGSLLWELPKDDDVEGWDVFIKAAPEFARFMGYPLLSFHRVEDAAGNDSEVSHAIPFLMGIPPSRITITKEWSCGSWNPEDLKYFSDKFSLAARRLNAFPDRYGQYAELLNALVGENSHDVIPIICGGSLNEYLDAFDTLIPRSNKKDSLNAMRVRIAAVSVVIAGQLVDGRSMAVRNRNAYSGARRHALDRYIELIPETAPLETAHVVRMMDKFFKNWNYLVYFIPEFSPATLRVKHGD